MPEGMPKTTTITTTTTNEGKGNITAREGRFFNFIDKYHKIIGIIARDHVDLLLGPLDFILEHSTQRLVAYLLLTDPLLDIVGNLQTL